MSRGLETGGKIEPLGEPGDKIRNVVSKIIAWLFLIALTAGILTLAHNE